MNQIQHDQDVKPAATIWNQLEAWARDFKPWQRFVLANAVRVGRLTDEQIDQAYRLFLRDNNLGDEPDPPIEIPSEITGRPSDAAPAPIWLRSVGDLHAVNALPSNAKLSFSPALTVVYGANGVGKSGFTRVLSNACFSRAQHPILPDVYAGSSGESLAATIVVSDGMQEDRPLAFDGSAGHAELKRIAVFDTAVARTHLVEQGPLGFKPTGFDVFPEMARVYDRLCELLSEDIRQCNRENIISKSFIAPESAVSRFVAALSADTDLQQLHAWAVFGEAESARRDEVQRQILGLQTKSPSEAISQLEGAKGDLVILQTRLKKGLAGLTEQLRSEYRSQISEFTKKARLVSEQGAESFKQDFFKGIGTPEWEKFLSAARALAHIEGADYPRDQDHCLLCHQPLDPPSTALIRRLWGFLASEARREMDEASASLDRSVQTLKGLRLDFFSADSTVRAHLARLSPALARQIDTLVEVMEADRASIVAVLENADGEIRSTAFANVDDDLTALILQVEADVARLREESADAAINALEAERVLLGHREILSQLLQDAAKLVSDLAWARKASGEPRRKLNPRPLTDKEGELFAIVVANDYRERFANECKALDCNLPVEFRTQGQRGQTLRSLSIKGGHSPSEILSEGEQRAVALADFLTEIALNPANAGIVLDDPVTSQDHQRKDKIAGRLVEESRQRQVVIFTHDLVFLTQLASAANDQCVDILTHWIERDGHGRPGQISLDDCPATTPQYRNTSKAEKTLNEAKAAAGSARVRLIQRGMGELRRTVEEVIPHFVLKQIVNRWTDRIIVTALKKVNWDDALITDIITAYEELSAYIEGHSHTEERAGVPPEPAHLEEMISRVKDLIKRAKPDRQ